MRRLLICTPSHAVHGGVEAIVNDLTRELPRRGWDVVLGLAAGQRFNDPQRYRAAYPDLNSIDIDGSGGTRQARVEALIRAVRTTRPDVVLAARIFDAYPSIALLKRQQGGPRLAVAIRACESDYLHDVRLHRAVIDLCVADGNLLAAACEEWCGMAAERVANIPGGVRMPQVIPEPRRRRTPIRLGYVGRLAQHDKRIFDLVPFLEELDRRQLAYQMDVVGTGPDAEAVAQALSEWLRRG
ncbi:MAG TPA: glycosyltransferase, partial [Vicinamibacterales bacterium]|nr:glycosyltransferase [Vicinamibacterales bacterium]